MTRAETSGDPLRKAMDLMLSLYEIDPGMQLSEILVFLHIALNQKDEMQTSTGARSSPKLALNPIPVRGHPRSQPASSQFRIERQIAQIEIPVHQ